jgi:site-specific recombinase XerC
VLLWRAGLRIHEALTLTEHDLEPRAGSVLVRHGKGGRRREVDMDRGAGSSSALDSNRGSRCRSVRCCARSSGGRNTSRDVTPARHGDTAHGR